MTYFFSSDLNNTEHAIQTNEGIFSKVVMYFKGTTEDARALVAQMNKGAV